MITKIQRLLSILLILALVANLIPTSVLAATITDTTDEVISDKLPDLSDAEISSESITLTKSETPVEILEEDIGQREEYYKEFLLSDGMRLATIYPESVHYEEDGLWKEIDNTLTEAVIDGQTVYKNTAGLWDVRFPQQLTGSNAISITKDGYTVSFGMVGELRSRDDLAVASINLEVENLSASGLVLSAAKISTAQIQQIDTNSLKEEAKFQEIVPDKLYSKLLYPAVYNNTNVIYDLSGNRLKESIVINTYDAALRGYQYQLNTGGLVPVLNEDQSIDLCDPVTNTVVMMMPAPFMLDDNGEYCDDVQVALLQKGGGYLLSYTLPQQWLEAEERAWPVVLDPAVDANNAQNNIQDITVAENAVESNNDPYIKCGYNPTKGILRTYFRYKRLPFFGSADAIVNATVELIKETPSDFAAPIEVHKVNTAWVAEGMTWSNMPDFNTTVEDITVVEDAATYSWDITEIARSWYADTVNTLDDNTGMMFKATNDVETGGVNNWQKLCSSDHASNYPVLTITYYTANGLEDYWDNTATSAGRAGTGYVQTYSGNLTWVHSDLGFDGNRMPVFINHIYNAHDAWNVGADTSNNPFGLGNGWRTNFNQTVSEVSDRTITASYVWEDGDGTKHYFKGNSATTYKDVDGLGLTLTKPSSGYTITDKYGNRSEFDTSGRLIRQANNQPTASSIKISYVGTTKQIAEILDGVDRRYTFDYGDDGLLDQITYYGNTSSTVYMYIRFGYSADSNLTSITYRDGKTSSFTYAKKNTLYTVTDIDGYKITFGYNTLRKGKSSRVSAVTESHNGTTGGKTTFAYAYNRTTLTDHNGNTQTFFFNEWGNTISAQDSEGKATFYQYAPATEDAGTRNRLTVASQSQNTVANMLKDSGFEYSENTAIWNSVGSVKTNEIRSGTSYLGNRSLKFECTSGGGGTAYNGSFTVKPGESYTFSAYVKCTYGSVHLRIDDGTDAVVTSDTATATSEWERLEVTYTNDSNTNSTITPQLYAPTTATAYIDCVQLEMTETASRYNLIENGDFRWSLFGWAYSNGAAISSGDYAPMLNTNRAAIQGSLDAVRYIYQTIHVNGSKDDAFVLAGWARGDSLPTGAGTRTFRLRMVFNNSDGTKTAVVANINPHILSDGTWQYVATPAVAEKDYGSITVWAEYSKNANSVIFDGIQLYKENFGDSYTYDDNGNCTSATDILGQKTEYTYNTKNDLTTAKLPTGVVVTNTYDNYHNVIKSVETGLATGGSRETTNTYDVYGNLTESTVKADGKTRTNRYTTYGDSGNLPYAFFDPNGNRTVHGHNLYTTSLVWVYDPKDTEETRTNYTYDSMLRVTGVSKRPYASSEDALTVNYTYTGDQLTGIQTASTTYTLTYGKFGLRTLVKAGSRELAAYNYTNDQNHYLESLDYGNGDIVKYTYDEQGRATKETYYEFGRLKPYRTVTYKYNNSGDLASVCDTNSGFTWKYYYDTQGRLVYRQNLGGSQFSAARYTYNEHGNVEKMTETIGSNRYTATYEYDVEQRPTLAKYENESVEYSYNRFGQLIKRQSLYDEKEVLTSTYTYRYPTSTTISDQVATLRNSSYASQYDVTYTYTYDANGNITSISDGTNTTTYVYDYANRLRRENNQKAGKTWTWEYDLAGNILNRKEYDYTTASGVAADSRINYVYGDSEWGDLLTSYNGQTITYDPCGNPLSDGIWTYVWEQGRQLSEMQGDSGTWCYLYDADGMRYLRILGSTSYYYWYADGRLTQMRSYDNGGTMRFTYGTDGRPLSITYGGATYYYVLNLQGDVVAILDSTGALVVEYVYDAWGRVLSTTGSKASSLGLHNPLRYRGYVYDRETGLYYVSSRYYDPEIGRWINADSVIAGVGGDLKGYNLFAYCFNNPVNMDDQDGNWPKWIKNTVKWVAKNIVKPVVKTVQKTLSKVDLTYSTGVNVSGTPSAWIFNGQIGVSMDTKGNVAIQASGGGGITGGDPGISITRYQSVTNAPNIDKLNDAYYQVGGSIAVPIEGVPVAAGGDVMFMPDPALNTGYFGLTGNVGFGTPGKEFHVEWGTTVTLPYTQFNVYEIARSVYIKIMEW